MKFRIMTIKQTAIKQLCKFSLFSARLFVGLLFGLFVSAGHASNNSNNSNHGCNNTGGNTGGNNMSKRRYKPPHTYKYRYTIINSHGKFTVYVQNHFQFDRNGMASFYDEKNSNRTTATMEKFNKHHYTAAHPYLPLPCIAEVTLVNNPSKKVIVKINDRGPFTKHNRLIDLSYASAKRLGFVRQGVALVRVVVLQKETKMLVEHGGNLKWDGSCDFSVAVQRGYSSRKSES